MKKFFTHALHVVLLLVLLSANAALLLKHVMHLPGPLTEATTVIIRKKTPSLDIAMELARAGVIRSPHLFFVIHYASGNTRHFKAGEYAFPAGISPQQVAEKLVAGEVVIHKITIPEGWNVREIRAALMVDPVLEGDITRAMPEGTILPETYHFTYGDTRDALIARMQQNMAALLDQLWSTRAEGLPFADKHEALILASIVEKETGVAEERSRVAAVFINRLKRGMKLQTDPSVIYGIEQKLGDAMGRTLTRTDLEAPTAYNTYVIDGLPPTPIANPGKDAITAVLHPAQSDELYFVANGTGGHSFAKTLEEHNRNVAAYRAALAKAAR